MCPLGPSPQYSKGTYIPVFPTAEQKSVWKGRIIESNDNIVTMGIIPSAECIVGKYMIFIGVVTPYGIRRTRRDTSTDVYILFNPWSPGLKLNIFKLTMALYLKYMTSIAVSPVSVTG